MAITITATGAINFTGEFASVATVDAAGGGSITKTGGQVGNRASFESGVSAGQIDSGFIFTQDDIDNETNTIELADLLATNIGWGNGTDQFGQTWAMLEVVAVIFRNTSITAGYDLTFGAGASNAAAFFGAVGDKVTVPPGGMVAIYLGDAGTTITNSTDQLDITNAQAVTASYELIVMGRTTAAV